MDANQYVQLLGEIRQLNKALTEQNKLIASLLKSNEMLREENRDLLLFNAQLIKQQTAIKCFGSDDSAQLVADLHKNVLHTIARNQKVSLEGVEQNR